MTKNKPVVVFIGTYPPRECGIATFTQDLLRSSRQFLGAHITCKVAALSLSPLDHYIYPPEVAWEINQNNKKEYLAFARELNHHSRVSGVILQHEYGIYGGDYGENILSFIEHCDKPILTTFHTVLPQPSPKMKAVTERIIRHSSIIVVLTQSSRNILETLYPISIGKVYVIPHGVHYVSFTSADAAQKKLKLAPHYVVSTFGLLSRGKGIEYVLQSLPPVIKKYSSLLYLIIGATHPAVKRQEGELYRTELAKLTSKLGLKKHVKFYDRYLQLSDLLEFLKATDIYISTSINPNQAVSGTLSYALGAGRAVISTEFAQAKEIITSNVGRLVPIKDTGALTGALLDLLSDEDRLKTMHQAAYALTRSMLWSQVATDYSQLLVQTVLPPINLRYLKKLTDNFGLLQFAKLDDPNPEFGYTLDDNARALIVCLQLRKLTTPPPGLDRLITIYFKFLTACQASDGQFINYLDLDHKPTPQNTSEDLSESFSRALWSLAFVINDDSLSRATRQKAKRIFLHALPHIQSFPHLRAQAFVIKALASALPQLPDQRRQLRQTIKRYASSLAQELKNQSSHSWHWFEEHLGYNNALLSESLLVAGRELKDQRYTQLGLSSLQFLIDKTFRTNMYLPIGNSSWYKRERKRSQFDQQPEDPASMVLALTTAYEITAEEGYKNLARKCFSWFLGNNSLRQSLYDYHTGACYDGLQPDRVNLNQGAESVISYLLARLAVTKLESHEN